jgi:hypothetical protein
MLQDGQGNWFKPDIFEQRNAYQKVPALKAREQCASHAGF